MEGIDRNAFRASTLQATIYTPDHDHTSSLVMRSFYPDCADFFDADPEVLPNMTGFPAEAPRIIMGKKDGSRKLEVAASRLNFFGRLENVENLPQNISQFYEEAIHFFSFFQDKTNSRIGRLAAVKTLFAFHGNPGEFLARHFCKDKWDKAPLNRPENFELHSHKVYQLDEKFSVNSWARNKTGFLTKDNEKRKIVLFEQDINTLGEGIKDKQFVAEDLGAFYRVIIPEFDNILAQYYPPIR